MRWEGIGQFEENIHIGFGRWHADDDQSWRRGENGNNFQMGEITSSHGRKKTGERTNTLLHPTKELPLDHRGEKTEKKEKVEKQGTTPDLKKLKEEDCGRGIGWGELLVLGQGGGRDVKQVTHFGGIG